MSAVEKLAKRLGSVIDDAGTLTSPTRMGDGTIDGLFKNRQTYPQANNTSTSVNPRNVPESPLLTRGRNKPVAPKDSEVIKIEADRAASDAAKRLRNPPSTGSSSIIAAIDRSAITAEQMVGDR